MTPQDIPSRQGRSALVTGASRGIGRAIALSLAAQAMNLTVTSRNEEDLKRLAEELRAAGAPEVAYHVADMADHDGVADIVGTHERAFGPKVDVLVINAGVGTAGSIEKSRIKRVIKTLDVNLVSAFILLQAAVPLLRRAAALEPRLGAKVIALSSLTGVYPERNLGIYGASKAALISLIETFNLEEAENGVLATAIAPGYVETDMSAWTTDTIPPETMVRVDDVVQVVRMLTSLSRNAAISKVVLARAGSGGYTA